MSIFNIQDNGPTAQQLADGFLKEADFKAEQNVQDIYDGIQRFWYRNKDADGNGVLEGDEPTGIETLQAMGTRAEAFLTVAYARVQMIITIQTALGVELIDLTKASAPYDFTFNADGSLATWTLKS